MTIIAMPAGIRISKLDWTLDQPAQVNRSDWTKRRQVVTQPGPSLWSATVDIASRSGEANILDVEAWIVDLEGQRNSFRLPASLEAQAVGLTPLVDGAGQTGRALNLKGGTPGATLKRGHKMTVGDQMVMLMAPVTFGSDGKAATTFKPSLRASPADGAAVEVMKPTVLVSLVASSVGWTIERGPRYQVKTLSVEEAI